MARNMYEMTYNRIAKHIIDLDALKEKYNKHGYVYASIENDPYMPFTLDTIANDEQGRLIIAISHTSVQNGDVMRDPEMTFAIDFKYKMVEALSYRNDYVGVNRECYVTKTDGKTYRIIGVHEDQQRFLRTWTLNLKAQGYKLKADDLKI